jgi:ribosomal protein S18 acetylase RimI-like enzyme
MASGANPTEDTPVPFRIATVSDLLAIIRMLADDEIGGGREQVLPEAMERYRDAFDAIDRDPNHLLIVAVDTNDTPTGVLQLSFLPCLTHQGSWRAQIEGVRVDSTRRGSGLGRMMIAHAVELARSKGCAMVQLTTDKRRSGAIRFYEGLGFRASHEGMKLSLR